MKITISSQKVLSFTIAYIVSFLGLLNGVNAITNVLGINSAVDTIVLYVLIWAVGLYTWIIGLINGKVKLDVILITLLSIMLFLLTILFFPDNVAYIFPVGNTLINNPIVSLFIYSFTGYIAVRNLKDYQHLIDYLRLFSYVVIISSMIIFFGIKNSFANQYMTLSYNMLLQVCFLVMFAPEKNKALHNAIMGIGIFIIVFGGARGPALGLLICLAFKLLGVERRKIGNKKYIIITILGMIGFVFCLFYKSILLFLVDLIGNMGITSRNIELLLYSNDDISSGRFEIYHRIIQNSNFLGHGLYGDRVILEGTYAHNLFFEWIAEFGIFIGIICAFLFSFLIIYGFKNGNDFLRKLVVVFIPNGFIGLMLSGSYLGQQPAFYILIALCVNVLLKENGRYRDENL